MSEEKEIDLDSGVNSEREDLNPEDLLDKPSFLKYFKETKKHRELYWSLEALYSICFSLVMASILIWMYKIDSNHFAKFIDDLIDILIGGYFGLLGFIIGAIAIILGLINHKLINNMRRVKTFREFISLCFMFALTALVNLWVIAELVLLKVIINMPLEFITDLRTTYEMFLALVFLSLLIHLPAFTLIYATYLVKVSLELLFIKYVAEEVLENIFESNKKGE